MISFSVFYKALLCLRKGGLWKAILRAGAHLRVLKWPTGRVDIAIILFSCLYRWYSCRSQKEISSPHISSGNLYSEKLWKSNWPLGTQTHFEL